MVLHASEPIEELSGVGTGWTFFSDVKGTFLQHLCKKSEHCTVSGDAVQESKMRGKALE